MKEKVLQLLRPKTVALGFSREEIESVAERLAESLGEEATDEQVNSKVDAVIPFLQLSQKAASRIINEKKNVKAEANTENENTFSKGATEVNGKETESTGAQSEFDRLYKILNDQSKQIQALLQKDTSAKRSDVYARKLEALPEKLRLSKMRDFSRMTFADDEAFDAFLADAESDALELAKTFGEQGLMSMGKPTRGTKAIDKQATDEEVASTISLLNIQ